MGDSRRCAMGFESDWAYSPGEVKILTSTDGTNFLSALYCRDACDGCSKVQEKRVFSVMERVPEACNVMSYYVSFVSCVPQFGFARLPPHSLNQRWQSPRVRPE